MKIDRAGYPFIAAALIPAAALAASRRPKLAASLLGLGAFFAYFFRDPERTVPREAGLAVSPADGTVIFAGAGDARWSPPGEWWQVTIFLSPMDVHINRAPVAGRITNIEYRPGRFLPAYDRDAHANELNEIWVDHEGQSVVFRQVVGILARRIVCRVREGDVLERGQRIGLMRFGSRMDVFLPRTATLVAAAGDTVVAGETVIARLGPAGAR